MSTQLTPSMPPPYEDQDCHRRPTLTDYTQGFMVKTREVGKKSEWRWTYSERESALREVRRCIEESHADHPAIARYIEVSLWQDGAPIEVWKHGRPQMGSGVTA